MLAPNSRIAASFTRGALPGTTTWAGMPRSRQASAMAAPWLPELWVTTPRAAVSALSENTALAAPRNLNAPTR